MSLPFRFSKVNCERKLVVPVVGASVHAGFPSPAEDYMDTEIDLNQELIKHPISTFLLRVRGDSMINAGINDGDLLIVDRGINPEPGHVVIAVLDGAFTLKRLTRERDVSKLESANPNYPSINIEDYENVQIWGVALYSIHELTRTSR